MSSEKLGKMERSGHNDMYLQEFSFQTTTFEGGEYLNELHNMIY